MKYLETLKKLYRTPKLTAPFISDAFNRRESIHVEVSPVDIGKPAFEITTDLGVLLLLERPVDYYNKKWGRSTNMQKRMSDFGIPVPLFLGQGDMSRSFHAASTTPLPHSLADQWLYDIFEPELVAAYFHNYFCNSEALKDYKLIIWEAIEAFYMGMDHVAIMSLIPVFEGGLRNLQNRLLVEDKGNVSAKVFERRLREILTEWGRRRVSKYVWHPGVYGNADLEVDFYTHICPQSDVINCFRIFFKDVLYKPTSGKFIGFNRHVIMHMLDNNFNNPTNFYRIFLALTHLTFIESLSSQKVPFFWQGYNEHSKLLSDYLGLISKCMVNRRKTLSHLGITGYPANNCS